MPLPGACIILGMMAAVAGLERQQGRARRADQPLDQLDVGRSQIFVELCSGPRMRILDVQHAGHGRARRVGVGAIEPLHVPRRAAAAAGGAVPSIAPAIAPDVAPFLAKFIDALLVLACVDVIVVRVSNDGEVGSGAGRGAPPRRLMHDRRALPRRPCRRHMLRLLLLLAHHVMLPCAALGTVCA